MQLIERDSFLEVLRSKFKTVAQGEGHCVLVAGEAGIGKTSLVKAFTSEIREDCIVYQGSCDALFTPRLLAPLYDIIWQVNENFSPGNLNIEERTALFANFFIELTKQSRRIVILFEDIHWADKATLDFIKFLARRITQLRCLFVLTFREDDSAFLASIRNITSQLLPETFTRLELTSLSRESVTNMALNKGYNGEDVFSISNGNPFYVNEILANYSPGVPEKIKDAILAVYDRQQEGTKKAWQIFSVIPEGLEVNRFAKLKNSWDKGMDHCFALNIILVANNRVIFKHELYRRTIETSLPPFKRIALNKAILDLFLSSFEKEGDIRRIVHYAKNSNESDLVLKYAPIAAKQAAALGAHVEAARLYLLAIEHEGAMDQEQLLLLYDAYSFECYLTNQVKEAIIYATKSLKLWKSKGDLQKIGDCLCLLTRLWITDDNLRNAENAASEAINLLQNESSSKTKGKAFSLMAQLKNLLDSQDACILWGEKALIISQELSDRELESEALGLIGSAKIRMPGCKEEGLNLLKKSLQIASDNSYEDYVGTAYRNLAYNCIIVKEYALAREAINLGIAHCEDHNLDLWRMYLLSLKLKVSFDQGEWSTAYNTAKDLAERESGPKMMRIVAFTTLATIDMRRGNFEHVLSNLLEALEMAFETMELQRITQTLTALLEYEWITNVRCIENMFIERAIALLEVKGNIYYNSEFNFWLEKARDMCMPIKEIYEAYDLSSPLHIKKAAKFWQRCGCVYNEAMTLFAGTNEEKRAALRMMQTLQAEAVVKKMKYQMRSSGIKKIPRGLRKSTLSNSALLTGRELDVLQLLKEGFQNKEIAGKLYISAKTVDHHISSILFKLDVNSRLKAVNEAFRQQILTK